MTDTLPDGLDSFISLGTLDPESNSIKYFTHRNNSTTNLVLILELLSQHGENLCRLVNDIIPLFFFAIIQLYQIKPVIIDGLTSSISRELNAEFTTVCIGSILPFRTDTLFENMVICVHFEMVDFDNIVMNTTSGINIPSKENHTMALIHAYPQKSSTVLTLTISFKF